MLRSVGVRASRVPGGTRLARLSYQTNKHRGRRRLRRLFVCCVVRAVFVLACRGRAPPKLVRPRWRLVLRKLCEILIEPYPSPGRSGHHLYENGDSDYPENKDHEEDCEWAVALDPIDGHE
jgi:hypothetical protein